MATADERERSWCAFPLLCVSAVCVLIAAIVLSVCIFSVSYRKVHNNLLHGTKTYGLFRFCFEPDEHVKAFATDRMLDDEYSCHLRQRATANTPPDIRLYYEAMTSTAGFIVYTYNNELKENQMESLNGIIFMYHYGWAYYYTGIAAAVLIVSFIVSLASAALHLKDRSKMEEKRMSLYL